MATIKKALRFSWRGKRYSVVDGKQSDYFNTPKPKRFRNQGASSDGESPESDDVQNKRRVPRRSDRMTRSVRDAVGTLKQRFRMSTRRRTRLQDGKVMSPGIAKRDSRRAVGKTPPRAGRSSDVKIYSPFYIETPKDLVKQRNGTRMGMLSVETPTRLKREVEALTSNMQALAALTPTTLRDRSRRNPQTSPLTNGSLRMRTPARRRIETDIY